MTRGRRRSFLICSSSFLRWMSITKRRYWRSVTSRRYLTGFLLIVSAIFFIVVFLQSRDDVLHDRTVRDVSTTAEGGSSTSRKLFSRWSREQSSVCGSRMTVYGGEFARLYRVIVDPRRATARRRGGEAVDTVMNQPETDELYRLSRGFFTLNNCRDDVSLPSTAFHRHNYLNDWLTATRLHPSTAVDQVKTVTDRPLIVAVTRGEYANLYHTLSDWYNVFLLTQFFNVTRRVHVLFVDAHPAGPLDHAWNVIFTGGSSRLSDYTEPVEFADLVWSIPEHRGPFEQHYSPQLPLADQFTRHVLSSYGIDWSHHQLNCSSVSLLLISRRDYITHVRNPSGLVRRKISNERQLEDELRTRNAHFRIRSVQLETLSVRQQLRVVASSDVMLGMTGAGLTHAIFLPARSGVVELSPVRLGAGNRHFQAIARWRRLEYKRWTSQKEDDDTGRTNYTTRVPPDVIDALVKSVVHKLCPQTTQTNAV